MILELIKFIPFQLKIERNTIRSTTGKKISFIFLLLLFVFYPEGSLKAQTIEEIEQAKKEMVNPNYEDMFDLARKRKNYSRECISRLKDGGSLFVRLKTRAKTIAAYKKAGHLKIANSVQKELDEDNQLLVDAFLEHFDFCPVYFYYSSSSDSIKNGNWGGAFVNKNLEIDKSIIPNSSFFMNAEIGSVHITPNFFVPEYDGPLNLEPTGVNRALIIKDMEFNQMSDPFPFYLKLANSVSKRYFVKVEKLNRNFHSFFQKSGL